MKNFLKISAVILSVIIVIGAASYVIIRQKYFGGKFAQKPQTITENDFLSVKDTYLINKNDEKVKLYGTNLGGWLIQENWMCPVTGEDKKWANLNTIEVFQERGFSEEQINTLFKTYQDNWITENDIKTISENGMNCIRVPFWYRNFMTGTNGEWINDDFSQNPGFIKLDWVIEKAQKYGLYVILDMHGCPGGQSLDHTTGTLNKNELYTDEENQNTMKKLWVEIAERYKGNPTVAAYDIMNEPQNNAGYDGENYYDPWESTSWELTNKIYDIMIKAIRDVDSEHIITVEGIWQVSNLPSPKTADWDNMMYQVHLYDDTKGFKKNTNILKKYMLKYKVAGYVGEFNNPDGKAILGSSNINYTSWTYKGVNSDNNSFFMYSGTVDKVNPYTDSYEEILSKWGDPIKTENFLK